MNISDLKCCRFCSKTNKLLNIFAEEPDNFNIVQKIKSLANIEITENDEFSKYICIKCAKGVKNSFDFKIFLEKADIDLRNSIKKASPENADHFNSIIATQDEIYAELFDGKANEEQIEFNNFGRKTEILQIEILSVGQYFEKEPFNGTEILPEFARHDIEKRSAKNLNTSERNESNATTNQLSVLDYKDEENNEKIEILDEALIEEDLEKLLDNFDTEKVTDTPEGDKTHLKKSLEERKTEQCPLCLKFFPKRSFFHHKRYHTLKDVKCPLCVVLETSQTALKQHIKISHNVDPVTMETCSPSKCDICHETIENYGEFIKHRNNHREVFSCDVCHLIFEYKHTLKIHKKVHIGQVENGSYACDKCNQIFANRSNLARHNRQWHLNFKKFVCEICSLGFYRQDLLKDHMYKHNDKVICHICGKGFSTLFCAKNHIKSHSASGKSHTSKKKTGATHRKCDICFKTVNTSAYKNHYKIHTGIKSQCDYCDMKFTLPQTLKTHLLLHTGEKPYECKVCDRKFRQHQQLKSHSRTHTGEKPHKCQYCEKTFALKGNLRVHERLHTGEKPYECQFCHQRFIDLNSLKRHKEKMHNFEIPIKTGS